MSQKRSTVFSKTQKYALCIFIENINGKEEEQKTVVPKRWLDKDNEILWWPRGVNVTNKKFSDPDDSWKQYTLVKVLVEGEESLCNDLLTQSSSSSASGNEDARKLKSKTTNIIEKVPDKPTKSVMCMLSQDSSERSAASQSYSPSPTSAQFKTGQLHTLTPQE